MNISIIGFGEAGPVFAKALQDAGYHLAAYDKLQNDATHCKAQIAKTRSHGIDVADSLHDAIRHAELVISTVTANDALNAATAAAESLHENCHWLDLNSVSPTTKASIAEVVTAAGATFTEAVAMDTVPKHGARVPILMCGPNAISLSATLNSAGLNTRVIGDSYGMASRTKLLRSVIIKGMESLFAESMEAAGNAGVEKEVLHSLQHTYPGLDWSELAGYQLSRSVLHAARRAAEMREATDVVRDLGVSGTMAEATASKQQELADREIASDFSGDTVADFINVTKRDT